MIVVGAGSGTRFGGPKQFLDLAGERVIDRCVRIASGCAAGVVLVLPEGIEWDGPAVARVVAGGETRSASVRAGLASVPDDAEVIVVHDAARPLATSALYEAVIAAVEQGSDGAVPALAVSDTVKRVRGSQVMATMPRDDLVTVQTPQAFRAAAFRRAHTEGAEATDDAELVATGGGVVVTVPGEEANMKITNKGDLTRAAALITGDHR